MRSKVSRSVLRGGGHSNLPPLLDDSTAPHFLSQQKLNQNQQVMRGYLYPTIPPKRTALPTPAAMPIVVPLAGEELCIGVGGTGV